MHHYSDDAIYIANILDYSYIEVNEGNNKLPFGVFIIIIRMHIRESIKSRLKSLAWGAHSPVGGSLTRGGLTHPWLTCPISYFAIM